MEIKKTRTTSFKCDDVRVEIFSGDKDGVALYQVDESIWFSDKARFKQFLQDCLKVLEKDDGQSRDS